MCFCCYVVGVFFCLFVCLFCFCCIVLLFCFVYSVFCLLFLFSLSLSFCILLGGGGGGRRVFVFVVFLCVYSFDSFKDSSLQRAAGYSFSFCLFPFFPPLLYVFFVVVVGVHVVLVFIFPWCPCCFVSRSQAFGARNLYCLVICVWQRRNRDA